MWQMKYYWGNKRASGLKRKFNFKRGDLQLDRVLYF